MNELHLFAGAGGGILGAELIGIRTVCAVEIEPYAAAVLCARQNDGFLPAFPIWDDVRSFDGRAWRGAVDVVSGGFPCQDISAAGKGVGIEGERSGLWREMCRIIGEVRPRYAFVENSPMLVGRGLERVLGDLAEIGYDAIWHIMGADDCGAPHVRKRIWILRGVPERVKKWPTPTCTEHYGAEVNYQPIRPSGYHAQLTLRTAVYQAERVAKNPTPTTSTALSTEESRVGGQLNPTWVEWLMGWPLGWTDLKPLAMDKFLRWRRELSWSYTV